MNPLRDLFHQPTERPIGAATFTVHKLQFDQFADALVLARYLEGINMDAFDLDALEQLAADSPERQSLKRTLAGCLALHLPEGQKQQLQPQDVDVMPVVMLAEALAVVMEVNADFFSQTLPRLLQAGLRMQSIGLALPSRLSAPGTTATA